MAMNKTGVFIFSFNELPGVLEKIVTSIRKLCPEVLVCLIDDGSENDIYRGLAKEVDCYIRLQENLGIGFARNTAFKIAKKLGLSQCVFVDGDGQHRVESVRNLLACSAEITIGSRFLQNGLSESTTGLRIAGISMIRKLLQALYGLSITDPTSGLRKYNLRAIEIMSQKEPYEYPEPLELTDAWANGLSVSEIPVKMNPRSHGKSTIGLLKSIYYMFDISLTLVLNYLHSK